MGIAECYGIVEEHLSLPCLITVSLQFHMVTLPSG